MTRDPTIQFVLENTRLGAPPLVPEISLRLAHEMLDLWRMTEEELAASGLPPPYWAFAWAGGQAVARYVLDHPVTVAGKRVLDFASGSGLVAIAAALAGAGSVVAAEIDPYAGAACRLNAAVNGVELAVEDRDLLAGPPPAADVVLAGDIFYERPMAGDVARWLGKAVRNGATVLVGDPGRSYLPRQGLSRLATYCVETTRELEDSEVKRTDVWLASHEIDGEPGP